MITFDTYRTKPPGLILGPYESLLAMISWMREALPESAYGTDGIQKLVVAPRMKEQLLIAYLLFGKFDAITGMGLLDSYLASREFQESRRELVGDFLLSHEKWSPFWHSLESGFSWPILQSPPTLDSADQANIISSCFKAMNRAGIRGYTSWESGAGFVPLRERLRQGFRNLKECDDNGLLPIPHQSESALLSLIYAISRSSDLQIPFFSGDTAAPAWIKKDIQTESKILRVIYEEVDWFPRPRTFYDAFSMTQDQRLEGLRTYIMDLTHRVAIGEMDAQEDLREQIQKEVRSFRNKPWAAKVGRIITYVAVPAEIAGMLCHTHLVGISVATLGAACEWVASLNSRAKKKHWLSISKLPKYKE